jgi:hypothetical protein
MNEFWRALVDFQHREVLVVASALTPKADILWMGVWSKRSTFGNYFRYDRFIIFV